MRSPPGSVRRVALSLTCAETSRPPPSPPSPHFPSIHRSARAPQLFAGIKAAYEHVAKYFFDALAMPPRATVYPDNLTEGPRL